MDMDKFTKIVDRAVDKVSSALGTKPQQKPDYVSNYNKLTKEDFTKLAQKFGKDNTLKYIQQMEKMKNG